jgi:pimeloyl-ACP methyl ester carboxylesterase
MGLLRRPTTSEIVEDGRSSRPYGPGAHSRASQKTNLRLRRHSRIPMLGIRTRYRNLASQHPGAAWPHPDPCLVVVRTEDVWLSAGNSRYLAEHIPGAQLLELPGVDHDPWVGDTEPVLATIQPTAAQAAFVAQNR